jgi:two-component system cell cycle response regulator
MTARVLVVDDILANVKLLEARLSAEYFEVLTAYSGREALEVLAARPVDVVLLDVMMPGMDGFEVCRRIKGDPKTTHVPVIMVSALDQTSDRVQGLKAGADDFLTKPVDDIALVTRVRNLARLKTLHDEMSMRFADGSDFALSPGANADWANVEAGARILLVEDQERGVQRVVAALARSHAVDVEQDLQAALLRLGNEPYDLLIVSLTLAAADGLRLCGQVRSLERLRHLPIVVIVDASDRTRLLRALDMGVNDYLVRPIDRHELLARVRTQIKRKRRTDRLRDSLDERVERAIKDALTGLFNRHYMESHLRGAVERARQSGTPVSVLAVDIDAFKAINDAFGHPTGDSVLREVAQRLRRSIRSADFPCRMGGEEFIVVMPDTGLERARQVGERVRAGVAAEPFSGGPGGGFTVTASVGVATLEARDDDLDALVNRADQALYAAKRQGRNRVVADAA